MNVNTGSPLVLETAAAGAAGFFRKYRSAFLSSLFCGFLAYGFAFTNKLINHDEAHSLFMKGGTVTSGRWGLGALDTIFPNYSMPWIYGILTLLLVAAAVCLLAEVFCIRNRLLQALLGGTVTVFPSLIGLFGYMFTSSSFALSFFLAVLSVTLLRRRSWYWIPAGACLVLSLSIYQSYISVAAALLVLALIRDLLTDTMPGAVLKRGIFYVAFLAASLVVYYLGTLVVLKITGTELGGYASGNFTFTPSGILAGAVLAYENFFRFFTEGYCGLIPTAFSRVLHKLLPIVILGLLLFLCGKKKGSVSGLVLLAVLVCMLPLAINCMYMITSEESIHTLVLYSFTAIYVFALMLAELTLQETDGKLLKAVLTNVLTAILVLVVIINTYVANQAYLHLHLRYENAYAFYTSLAADIKLQPEFTPDTKLAVIGSYRQPEFYTEQFEHIHTITGVYGFVPDNYSNESFLTYYVGFPVPFASQEEIAAIRESDEFAEMSTYPYYGSLRSFGDILVVKLS